MMSECSRWLFQWWSQLQLLPTAQAHMFSQAQAKREKGPRHVLLTFTHDLELLVSLKFILLLDLWSKEFVPNGNFTTIIGWVFPCQRTLLSSQSRKRIIVDYQNIWPVACKSCYIIRFSPSCNIISLVQCKGTPDSLSGLTSCCSVLLYDGWILVPARWEKLLWVKPDAIIIVQARWDAKYHRIFLHDNGLNSPNIRTWNKLGKKCSFVKRIHIIQGVGEWMCLGDNR